jgi:hypothetical protein
LEASKDPSGREIVVLDICTVFCKRQKAIGELMRTAFNVFGRVVSTLLGISVVFMGFVWILQAFDLAFNTPLVPGGPVSFMVKNHQWAVYGAIAVLIGLAQITWSNIRPALES